MASKHYEYTPERMAQDDAYSAWVWAEVYDLMGTGGSMVKYVPAEVFAQAYLLGDGFGTITHDWAVDQCYDRSHIRDSTPEALERILTFLWADGRIFANVIEPRARFEEIKRAVSQ